MFTKVFKTVFSVIFFYLPLQAMCWGQLGHRIVGEIAESYLTPKAKAEIKKILGNESVAMASTWADFIRSDSAYNYLNTWHYIDFPKELSYGQMKDQLKKDTTKDAYTAINFLVKELRKKNLAPDKKKMYLRLLIHIVGDVHQPLHVSPEGTSGGNDVKVQWFGTNSNLHRVWDEQLIADQKLSYTEYTNAINFSTMAQRKKWQSQPISEWLYQSYTISQSLQNEIKSNNQKLSYRYNYDHIQTLNQQLLKGGIRLAGVLNSIFGK